MNVKTIRAIAKNLPKSGPLSYAEVHRVHGQQGELLVTDTYSIVALSDGIQYEDGRRDEGACYVMVNTLLDACKLAGAGKSSSVDIRVLENQVLIIAATNDTPIHFFEVKRETNADGHAWPDWRRLDYCRICADDKCSGGTLNGQYLQRLINAATPLVDEDGRGNLDISIRKEAVTVDAAGFSSVLAGVRRRP